MNIKWNVLYKLNHAQFPCRRTHTATQSHSDTCRALGTHTGVLHLWYFLRRAARSLDDGRKINVLILAKCSCDMTRVRWDTSEHWKRRPSIKIFWIVRWHHIAKTGCARIYRNNFCRLFRVILRGQADNSLDLCCNSILDVPSTVSQHLCNFTEKYFLIYVAALVHMFEHYTMLQGMETDSTQDPNNDDNDGTNDVCIRNGVIGRK